MTNSPPDYDTEQGARKLAERIKNFWVSQGYPPDCVRIRVESDNPDMAVIRSNLRNGTPPGKPVKPESVSRV